MAGRSEAVQYEHTPGADITKIAKHHCNPHKLFLNLVRELRAVRVSMVVDVFSRCCTACKMDHNVSAKLYPAILANQIMQTINEKLEGEVFGRLEVVSDERFPDEQYIVLAWPAANQATTNHLKVVSPAESKFFYELIGKMFAEDNEQRGEVPIMDATLLGVENGEFKPAQSEEFLHKLVRDAVFTQHDERETYSLHPKAVLEFQTVLINQGYNIPTCPVCRKLIVLRRTSTTCTTCNTEIHNMCIHRMVEKSDRKVPCPGAPITGGRCKNKYDEAFAADLYFDDPIVLDLHTPEVVESDKRAATVEPGASSDVSMSD
uniref:Phorbol-ester/DAG-type domain-containing protein n=1 Tax=Panagrellus redivivus TaxID=6233 RepID=A0A7E4VVX8_PANRE